MNLHSTEDDRTRTLVARCAPPISGGTDTSIRAALGPVDPRAIAHRRRAGLVAAVVIGTLMVGGLAGSVTLSSHSPETALTIAGVDRCPPADTREVLRSADLAFAGVVARVTDREVVIDVDGRYRGAVGSTVELIRATGTALGLRAGTAWTVGQRYLVAARGSMVIECSGRVTAPWGDELAAIYTAVFR
jgi:hypothetical protein